MSLFEVELPECPKPSPREATFPSVHHKSPAPTSHRGLSERRASLHDQARLDSGTRPKVPSLSSDARCPPDTRDARAQDSPRLRVLFAARVFVVSTTDTPHTERATLFPEQLWRNNRLRTHLKRLALSFQN